MFCTLSRRLTIAFTLAALLAACSAHVDAPSATPSQSAAYPASSPSTGTITGRIVRPTSSKPSLSQGSIHLWLEDASTGAALVTTLPADQASFAVTVPHGTYVAYAWSTDYRWRGEPADAHNERASDGHGTLTVRVGANQTASSILINRWIPAEERPLVLVGRLIDGAGGEPAPDRALVILGDRIVALGAREAVAIPADAEIIELPDATILPGFINTHVHNSYGRRTRAAWAQAGVTTVRDLGERLGVPWFSLRDSLNQHPELARVVAVGPLVTVSGGYPIAGMNFSSLTVESPEDARRKVSQLIEDGADAIKITLTFGRAPTLSLEQATAIVEVAHERGIPVTVHATEVQALERALEAGADDIAHLVTERVPDQLIQRMVRQGVSWVPTLEAMEGRGLENLKRFVQAGGVVAMGNDAGYLSDLEMGMPLREILWMAKAGMTPSQIIVSATRDAALVCRREATLGTLEIGKLADVLVVDGDPLQDLRALQRVRLVIHGGTIIRDER
jgi:imidazolonepropionase-like amidohydrolase